MPVKIKGPSWKLVNKVGLTTSFTPVSAGGGQTNTRGAPHIKEGSKFYKNLNKICEIGNTFPKIGK